MDEIRRNLHCCSALDKYRPPMPVNRKNVFRGPARNEVYFHFSLTWAHLDSLLTPSEFTPREECTAPNWEGIDEDFCGIGLMSHKF